MHAGELTDRRARFGHADLYRRISLETTVEFGMSTSAAVASNTFPLSPGIAESDTSALAGLAQAALDG